MIKSNYHSAIASTLLFALSLLLAPAATEYFVAGDGDDANSGLQPAEAFRTVQRGVDALNPGDTLIIAPGEYHEAVAREDLGSEDAKTVIRALIVGTAVIRGDVPAPPLAKVKGYRFIYSTPFTDPVQAVNEVDTLKILEPAPDVATLETLPGSYYHDAENGILYISPTDLLPAEKHHYTVSVLPGRGGIYLTNPRNVEINGLVFTGFNTKERLERLRGGLSSSDAIPHGVYLWRSKQCIIRNCTAFLNAAGLTILSDGENKILDCHAYGNYSRYSTESGNITIFQPQDEVVTNCWTAHGRHGLRMYADDGATGGMMTGNVSWNNRGAQYQVKAGRLASANSVLAESIALGGGVSVLNIESSILETGGRREDNAVNNIFLDRFPGLDPEAEFADPVNMDYRLQSTSQFRGAGTDGSDLGPFQYQPTVFYLSQYGNDRADGQSVGTAWRTLDHALSSLRPGNTLYITAGTYSVSRDLHIHSRPDMPLSIRGRGTDSVIIKGLFEVYHSDFINIERIQFDDGLLVRESTGIRILNCAFTHEQTPLVASQVRGLRIEHCEFSGYAQAGITATQSVGIYLSSNLYDISPDAVAVRIDDGRAVSYSDYNSYSRDNAIWYAGGASYDLDELIEHNYESYSIIAQPNIKSIGGVAFVVNTEAFAGRGAKGTAIGKYNPFVIDQELQFVGPNLHSATDTTANINWWSSAPTEIHLQWSGPDGSGESLVLDSHRFGTFSLTGLKPNSKYTVTISGNRPMIQLDGSGEHPVESASLTFTTSAVANTPRTVFVSPDGNDSNSGLSLADAWKTISHAAAKALPGDTIKIAGGTYTESVIIQATGEKDKPITFTPIPGHRVILDGDNRLLDYGFLSMNKSHLHIDGIYFRNHQFSSTTQPWSDRANSNNAAINLYRGENIRISRCFHDGRGAGYGPGMVIAIKVADLVIENSVICDSMGGGISFYNSPNVHIHNNVFLRNKIQNISEAVNEPDQLIVVEKNIFTDNLPGKVHGAMFAIGRVESFKEDNNCYFFRIPGEERMAFQFYGDDAYQRPAQQWGMQESFDSPAIRDLVRMTFHEFKERFNPDSTSLVADPEFAAAKAIDHGDESGDARYIVDVLMRDRSLDFNDLFATNPEVVERDIGLQPEAFKDFKFE